MNTSSIILFLYYDIDRELTMNMESTYQDNGNEEDKLLVVLYFANK